MRQAVLDPRNGDLACGIEGITHGKLSARAPPVTDSSRAASGVKGGIVPARPPAVAISPMGPSGQGKEDGDKSRHAKTCVGTPARIAVGPATAQVGPLAAGSHAHVDPPAAAADSGPLDTAARNGEGGGGQRGLVQGAPLPAPTEHVENLPLEGNKPDTYDVFISYAHKDGMSVASQLEDGLTRRGLRIWRDKGGLVIGNNILPEIKQALANSLYAAVVITPSYIKRPWTQAELGGILLGKHTDRFFPILYKTSQSDVATRLSMLAGTFMGCWDENPKKLMDDIAHIVQASKSGAHPAPTAASGIGAPHRYLLDQTNRGALTGIPKEINGTTMPRSRQVDAVVDMLEHEERVAIIGNKGVGKSVLSCLLYERLAASGPVLLVRCDNFLGIESTEELDKAIVPGLSLADLARRAAADKEGGMTVIFDSLDAASRNEKTMRAFKRLLGTIWGSGARTVVTVRSYDYRYSPPLAGTDWGKKYDLGLLTDAEVDTVLQGIGKRSIPPRLKDLLYNPLNLSLYSLILERSPDADLTSITHEIDLYDEHWRHYVELEPLSERVRDVLYGVAEDMFKARKTTIPYNLDDQEASGAALSSNILVRGGDGGTIRYFHHAYLDYAMSRTLLERHPSIVGYLRADEHNVFLLPTLSFTLAMAYKRDPGDFASIVEEMARADIKHYWKNAALAALAVAAHDETCDACLRLKSMLADNLMLQRHFLLALARQPCASWFPLWGEALAEWSANPGNYNGAFLIDCLKAAASNARYHERVFAAAKALVESSNSGWARKQAVIMLADIDATGKTELLEAMSCDSDPLVRSGVARNLARLLEHDPDVVPGIFCNLYSYAETSGESTEMARYGTLRMTSTLAQDNYMIKYEIDNMLAGLIKANASAMLRAVILAAEQINAAAATSPGGLVDDRQRVWTQMAFSGDAGTPFDQIKRHVDGCDDEDFSRLVPILEGTRLASFRGLLIGAMARRGRRFLDDLAVLLYDPRIYETYALRQAVRNAVGVATGLLDKKQAMRIYKAIAASNVPNNQTEDEVRRSNTARAAYLSELPRTLLSADDASIVDRFSRPAVEDAPLVFGPYVDMPSKDADDRDSLSVVEEMLEDDLDRGDTIVLLENMLSLLDDRNNVLEEPLLSKMEEFLICNKGHADPASDEADEPGDSLAAVHSVRGLVAECLAGILARRKSASALDAIQELSDDPAGSVRSDVARSLKRLLPGHYDAVRTIALSYSRDLDPRVQFFLPEALYRILQREPALASEMIENTLATSGRASEITTLLLLDLAIARKEPHAARLLRRIADEGAFDKELRMSIPFALKNRFLGTRYQDAALDLLYRLLSDSSREVRQKAAFFTLNGFDDNPDIDNRSYIAKIAPHLSRMIALLEKAPLDLFIAETLAGFFEEFWKEVPDAALSYLEKTVKQNGPAVASEPSIADRSLRVLAGLLHYYAPYGDAWNRCIDVLDALAAVGWPAALEMLAEMGRRD